MTEQATAESTPVEKRTPYRNKFLERIEEEEKEIEELERQNRGEITGEGDEEEKEENEHPAPEDGPEPQTAEEKTWKKRYGDLRKHQQEEKSKWKKEREELNKRIEALENSVKESPELPKTEAEVEEFRKNHPDVLAILESVASKKLESQNEEIQTKLQKLEEKSEQEQFQEAEKKLKEHVKSDWDTDLSSLQADEAFHHWVAEQPEWMQDAVYEGGTDWRSAARVIDLYFLDNGTAKKKQSKRRKEQEKEAASPVNNKSQATEPTPESKKLKESEIHKMTSSEFERRSDEIESAYREGRIIYDMTGGAR